MKFLSFFLYIFIFTTNIYAVETCSRIAVINYQEVLVDTSSEAKGEGLRFYIEKDPAALELLNQYQEMNQPSIWNAAASTLGSLMVIGGLFQTNENASGITNRNTLIFGGIILSTISFLVSKTIQYNSEIILERAVEQYNKRNLPRIYFSPYQNDNNYSIGVGIQQEF